MRRPSSVPAAGQSQPAGAPRPTGRARSGQTAEDLMRIRGVAAVIFDTDGVILDSATLHAAAWKEAFDACLRDRRVRARVAGRHAAEHGAADLDRPFDEREDYRRYVDGKSRLDGAASFLTSRGVYLPTGGPDDQPGTATISAVAARKDQVFTEQLRRQRIPAWPGTVRLLEALRRTGVARAAISASRHARELLSSAAVIEHFQTVVDGNDAARLQLPSKPHPALFLEAAGRLGVSPRDAAIVEDALAGVEAGRRGGFGLIIAVARGGQSAATELRRRGADVVVSDLGEFLPAFDQGAAPAPPEGRTR